MAAPRPPPPLIDDVMVQILLRLPPDEPEHLFCAALVCKPWLRILRDPGFLRRYRAFHGDPPLIGLLRILDIRAAMGDPFPADRTMAPPLTDLNEDATAEILLRLPPDEPEHLFRAALVCKPWLRILCDPGFLRRYRAFHGAPPLLGLLHRLQVFEGMPPPRFASTTSMPDFPHPEALDSSHGRVLDCRHGRVLALNCKEMEDEDDSGWGYRVWDPVTGDRHAVPIPDTEEWIIESVAVLCATNGCGHLDCRGGPFRVVFMATHDYKPTILATMYSSETGVWSQPISLDTGCEIYAQHMQEGFAVRPYWYLPYLQPRRGTHVGDGIYNTIRLDNTIVKYDLCKKSLSLLRPPTKDVYYIALMAMDNSTLGFACVLGSSLHTWSRKVDTEEAAEWVPYRVIDLEKMIPIANPEDKPVVVGFAEGVGVVFVSIDVGLFTIKLSSGKAKKVDDSGVYFSVLPYMSFYTPDCGRLLSLARAH